MERLALALLGKPKNMVFLSFKGEAMLENFIDDLVNSLLNSCFTTYRNADKLVKGWGSIFRRKNSSSNRCSIVVLSKEYASSTKHLDELVRIIKLKRTTNLHVLPVFYKVNKDEVRYQIGRFQAVFLPHMMMHNDYKVQKWRAALSDVATITGVDFPDHHNRNDAEIAIRKIVQCVMDKFCMQNLKIDYIDYQVPSRLDGHEEEFGLRSEFREVKGDSINDHDDHDHLRKSLDEYRLDDTSSTGSTSTGEASNDSRPLTPGSRKLLKDINRQNKKLLKLIKQISTGSRPLTWGSRELLDNDKTDDSGSSMSIEEAANGLSPSTWGSRTLYYRHHASCLSWHLVHLHLVDCDLQNSIIPDDLSHLWSLEHLDLSGNLMRSLPDSIKSLSRLHKLSLDRCTSLRSLPEFPVSLDILKIRDCPSLKPSPFLMNRPHPLLSSKLLDSNTNYPFKFYLSRSTYEKNPHDCFVSLNVIEFRSVELVQFLVRLGKMGIVGLSNLNLKANHQIFQLEDQRIDQIHTIPASITSLESTTFPVDSLPSHLVELDLEDCNILDDHYVFKNLAFLCFLKQINLSGSLITTLPDGITRLTELRLLNLSRCKMLQSLPELPTSLEELNLYCCSSLQKVVNLPNLFTSLKLNVRSCGSLVEVTELFMLKPMESVDVETIHKLHLLEHQSSDDIEVPMFNFMTYSARKMPFQILYECGIVNVFLPGKKVPYWFGNLRKDCSSMNLNVPSLVNDKTWSLNLCVVYSLSYQSKPRGLPLLMVKICNKTKGRKWTYCPTIIGLPCENENMLWFSHWKFKDQLQSRHRVNISFACSAEFSVKQYGVDFVYEDNEVDSVSDTETIANRSHLPNQTLSDEDLAVYKLQQIAEEVRGDSYLLSNHHYPTSSDKYWLDQFLQLHPDFL